MHKHEEPQLQGTLTITLPNVLGFLVQCAICPQQAVVASQPEQSGWLCPRCAEVANGPSADSVVDAYISCGAEHPVVRNHHCALPEGHESVVHTTEVFTWPRQPGDAGSIDLPAGMTLQQYVDAHRPPDGFVRLHANMSEDDDYPVGQVRG